MGHTGTVEGIQLAQERGGATFDVDTVTAVPGKGLEGDRVFRDADAGRAIEAGQQVTLIEAEALEAVAREEGIELTHADSRRNIRTRGVALNHLVERDFRVGEVTLRGVLLCEPCGYMEKLCGKKGALKALIHRGGLRAEVTAGGTIRVGDAVEPL